MCKKYFLFSLFRDSFLDIAASREACSSVSESDSDIIFYLLNIILSLYHNKKSLNTLDIHALQSLLLNSRVYIRFYSLNGYTHFIVLYIENNKMWLKKYNKYISFI